MIMLLHRLILAAIPCLCVPNVGSKFLQQVLARYVNKNGTRQQLSRHKTDSIQNIIFRFLYFVPIFFQLCLERRSRRIQNHCPDLFAGKPRRQIVSKFFICLLLPFITARIVIFLRQYHLLSAPLLHSRNAVGFWVP